MAEFKLGRLRFVWKGTWTSGTAYVKDDIVKYGGTSYVCMAGHTANADFNVDITANKWQIMSAGQQWVSTPWTVSTSYKLNDLVKYGGNIYVCTSNHTSSSVTNGGFYTDETSGKWDLFSSGNEWKGIWLPSTYYKLGDLVKYNGITYVCSIPHLSETGVYSGESIDYINIVSGGLDYTSGLSLAFSAPELVGGTLPSATITVNGAGTITGITFSSYGSGYTSTPTVSVQGPTAGSGANLQAIITSSFVDGLESDLNKWEVFSEGFKWRGDWNGSQIPASRVATSYAVNDVVKFGASLYICATAHTSSASAFEENKWETFVEGLQFEDSWSAITEYQVGDIVTYGGYAYVAIARNTSQIPPNSAGFWNLLTTGFNNRSRYESTQTYKVGDLVLYGGNTFVAIEEVTTNETPNSAAAKWEKITDGFRWREDWDPTPTEATYKIGDIVKYSASTYLCIAEHVPSDAGTTITATATSSTGNQVTVSDSSLLNANQPITFTGTGFGNLNNGVTYYVKTVVDGTHITLSESLGGSTKVLLSATGSLTGTFTSRPDQDTGIFWDSFAEGDANNVLLRRGDLVTRNAIQNVRLAKGQTGSFLKAGDQDLEWDLVGRITRVFYVSTDGVDASTRGTTLSDPWRTIKYACDYVRTQVVPTVDQPAVIMVKTGVYSEEFPISVPKYTSLVGDELRMSIVQPTADTSGNDKFYMRDSTTIRNFTFRGATGANLDNGLTDTYTDANQYGTRRPTGGAWVSLDPGTGPNDENVWVGQRSPYIQNVTLFGDYCVGQKIDGSLHNGGNKSITSNDFTCVLSNSVGAWCLNQGRAELVSVFTYYGYIGYLCEAGGVIRATNGNNSYGDYGSVSEGVDPTEISRTSSVDNRRLNAIVDRVQTDGADKVIYLEYLNAGEEYTTATYGFTGSGVGNTIITTPVIQDGGVCEVRILDDGENYTSVTNNAQAGTNLDIRLGAADIALTNAYVGERIIIIDGAGSGQYAYITSFDGGSKLCTLGMESFTPLIVTNTTSSTNRLTVANTSTLSADMPFTLTETAFGGLATATQYYVKAVISGTQFTAYTDTVTKTEITLTTATGEMHLHKSGWDTFVEGITETFTGATRANPVEITTTVPHAFYTGMEVSISGVVGMTQLNGNTYYVSKTGSSTFALYSDPTLLVPVDGTAYTTYISGGTGVGKQPVLEFLNTTSRYVIEPRVVVGTGSGASATAVQTQGISTIAVSTGGGGFTIPPQVIISGDGTGSGGFGATATSTIEGEVESVLILDRGTGYASPPTLTFVGGGLPNGSPDHATATATITSTIKTVEVTDGGTGFTTPPSVTVSGTGGSGAIISAQISNVVGGVTLTGGTNSGGSGYTSAPTVEFIGGEPLVFAEGTAVLDAEVTTITVQEGGSGYDDTTTCLLLGGGGFGATADVEVDFGNYVAGVTPGVITGIIVTNNGTGYATPPAVVISGTGVDAVATSNIEGSVSSITITNPGRGYQTTPTITFASTSGAGAQGTVTLTGSVISLTVVDGGTGWVGTPTLGFSGGGGINATANVTAMDSVLGEVTLTSSGTGYTSNPAISVTGGITFPARSAILRSRIDGIVQTVTVTDPGGSYNTSPLITFAAGNQFKTPFAGNRYYVNASARIAIGISQKDQTLAGIERLRVVARAVVQNLAPASVFQTAVTRVTGTAGPSGIEDAVDVWTKSVYYTIQNGENYTNAKSLILANREWIRAEVMEFWDSFYPGVATATWSRDVGLMIDAIATDIGYRGVDYTILAGLKQIFLGTARTTNLAAAVSGIEFIRDLVIDIIENTVVTAPLTGIAITGTTGTTNRITAADTSMLSEGDNVIFIGTAFGGLSANTVYYVKDIISSTEFTVSTTVDGSAVVLSTASGTLTLSMQYIDDTLTLETGSTTAAENLFNFTIEILEAGTLASSSGFASVAGLLLANKQFIKAEVIAYINTTYEDFDYNQTLCARDVGYIVDAISYDLVNAEDNNPSVTSSTTGVISSITVNDGGIGYSSGTVITITGGGPAVVTTATATPIINSLTGTITGFTMTEKGAGYSATPSVVITPDPGTGAFIRAKIVGGNVNSMTIISPGSGYLAGPNIRLIDANNTSDARFIVRTADGVLDQPRFTSRGTGFTAADALVDGDGYADIAQVGQFVYVDNLTNIPTPGANIQFEDSDQYYKLVTIREVLGPSGIIGARNILLENKEFIQWEILSYLNDFTYDTVKCSRDIGIIIDALTDDYTYEGNTRLLAVLYQHQRGIFDLFDQQRIQTASALQELQDLINDELSEDPTDPFSVARNLDFLIEWVKNGTAYEAIPSLNMPNGNFDTQDDRAKNCILANLTFIAKQTTAWMVNNSKIVGFTDATFEAEIRQIAISVAYDLTYTGNVQTVEFGKSCFVDGNLTIPGVPGTSAAAKADYLDMLTYLNTLLQDIGENNNVTPESGNTTAQDTTLPGGDTASSGRISTLMTGFSAIINNGFAGSGVTLTNSNFTGFNITSRNAIQGVKSTLQSDIVTYVTNTFVNFTYDQDVCFRDTGLIVQAFADDIFGDVAKTIEAGQRYYAATAALVLSDQRPQTLAALNQIDFIVQKLIRNQTYTRTQTNAFQVRFPSITNGDEASEHLADLARIIRRILEYGEFLNDVKQLLLDNKAFIQAETVAFVSASYENLNYDVGLCYRDVGLIVDAIAYDIYGGLSRSREVGLRYYQSESALRAITGEQYAPTIAAMNYAKDIIQAVFNNEDPDIRFQEVESRVSDPTVVFNIDQLVVDEKIDTCFTTIISVINNGPSSLPEGRYSARLQISPPLTIETAPAHATPMVIRSRYSQVRLTGHDFLNIGTGNKNDTNYPGIPLNAPNQNNEIVEQGGGRVFYTSTDQDGNFRVGELFKVEQSTGIATLNADAFNLSGLNELTLGGVNLGGSGATINEFSTDGTFFANSDSIVPTQKAIKTYIQSALGSGGGNIAVNAVTAGDVFITGKEIDTVGGARLTILSDDGLSIESLVNSTSIIDGALTVAGGVGISQNLNVGATTVIDGTLTVTNTGFVKLATGTTFERPVTPSTGMIRFNTSTVSFEGYNGTQWTGVGGGNPWAVKTSNYTAVNNDRLLINTSAGPITITLPLVPTIGDQIKFIDASGTFDFNNLIIDRNGQPIMGDTANMTVSTRNAAFTLVYYNSVFGWRLGDA